MTPRKEYKNSIRSKEKIQDAVFALLKENKGMKNITISAIVEKANVNRGTFYNHYKSVDEVIEDVESKLIRSFDEALCKNKDLEFEEKCEFFFTTLTQFLKDNDQGFRYIVKYIPINIYDDFHNKLLESYRNFLVEELSHKATGEKQKTILLTSELISNGVAATYLNYLKGEFSGTLDDISKTAMEVVRKLIAIEF